MNTHTPLPNSEHTNLSPNVRAFLDGLAELIAESILQDSAEGKTQDSENACSTPSLAVEAL